MTNRTRLTPSEETGFTLIEVLVVMLIIGILSAIAIPLFLHQQTKAHESAAKSDAASIGMQVSTFLVDGNPDGVSAGALPIVGPASVTLTETRGATLDTSTVRLSPGDSLTAMTYNASTGSYCVEVTPAATGTSAWNATPSGVVKGNCP